MKQFLFQRPPLISGLNLDSCPYLLFSSVNYSPSSEGVQLDEVDRYLSGQVCKCVQLYTLYLVSFM